METTNNKMPPYSQHYRCALELFKDYRTGLVFQFLFDEFLCRNRQNKTGGFTFSMRQIAKSIGVNKNAINNALHDLEELGAISLDGSVCSVDAAYFVAVVRLFYCAVGTQREAIKKAFLDHDIATLRQIGLKECDSIQQEVYDISTGVPNQDNCPKSGQLYQYSTTVPNQDTCTILGQVISNLYPLINGTTVPNQDDISANMDKSYQILEEFRNLNSPKISEERQRTLANALICYGAYAFLSQVYDIRTVGVLNQDSGCPKSGHINKINKENELNERSEFSSIVGVEKDKEGMGEKGKDEGGFGGLEIIELKSPISERERYSQYKKAKPYVNVYRNKPYFSERDMEKITGDLYECTKSPVKLFIYNLWDGLYEWYQEEIEDKLPVDEYGEPIKNENEKSDLDMLRTIISQTMFARIVKQAWYETEGQIESKMFQTEHDNIPIEIEKLPDIHLENLIDWKEAVNENGEHGFVISLEGFRNIEADDVTEIKQPKSREEKKAMNRINRQFLATVITTDDSQLTPIEALIKDFTCKFIILDEHFHVEGFTNGKGDRMDCTFLPGYLIKPWTIHVLERDMKPEEFYSTFNLPEYKDGSNLHMAATIFSYQKVQRCNEMRGFQSIISEETLRNAPILDD